MQKVEYKSFDSKKIPNQYDLSDESKARSKVHDKDYIRGDSMIFKKIEKEGIHLIKDYFLFYIVFIKLTI